MAHCKNCTKLSVEISELRKDINAIQRSLVRIEFGLIKTESSTKKRNRSLSDPDSHQRPSAVQSRITRARPVTPNVVTVTPRQQLLQKLADKPIHQEICWYHRQFGAAADPSKCMPGCKFVAPPKLLPKPKTTMVPIPAARNSSSKPLVQTTTNVSVQPTVSTVKTSKTEPMDETLEETLLNLSDSE